MNERIKELRKALGLTQREFGERIGLKPNSITSIELGRNPSEQTVRSICKEYNVNEEWLRTGEGEMFLPEKRDNDIAEFVGRVMADESDSFKRRFISMLSRLSTKDWEVLERMAIELADKKKEG